MSVSEWNDHVEFRIVGIVVVGHVVVVVGHVVVVVWFVLC